MFSRLAYWLPAAATIAGSLMGAGVASAAPMTPSASDADLVLWLKADAITGVASGGAVTTWEDSSGANNDVTQGTAGNRPTLGTIDGNGLSGAAVTFDGVDDTLQSAAGIALGQAHTIFVVGNARGTTSGFSQMFFSYANGEVESQVEVGIYTDANGRHYRMRYPGRDTFNSPATANLTGPRVLTQRRNSTADAEAYIDGSLWLDNLSSSDFTTPSAFRLGRHSNAGQYLTGDIAEVIVYNRALTDTERAGVEEYLTAKYVPEPASVALLAAGGLLIASRRR